MSKQEINSKKILLPYTLIMLTMTTIMQVINIIRGNIYDLSSGSMLFIIFLYYLYSNYRNHSSLKKVRFGLLISHYIAYFLVNLSFVIASFAIYWNSIFTIIGDGYIQLPKEASGVLCFMPIFWGVGLLVHTIASVANRGYEEK
jgi:hypothetical protein